MRRPFYFVLLSSIFTLILSTPALAINSVKSSVFTVEPPTLLCLGFEWKVTGDDNHNAEVTVSYRKTGETSWNDGMPLLRINGEMVFGHDQEWAYEAPNMFAGSIMELTPGTSYDCRFVMSDPDGVDGITEKMVTVITRSEPKPYDGGRILHVYPLGYEGPKEEPSFTGLKEAYFGPGGTGDWGVVPDPSVGPGDIILIHAGLYKADRMLYAHQYGIDFHGAYVLTKSGTPDKPIAIKAAGDGEVIFDGDGSYRLFDIMAADYTYFEGLTIRNTDIAFYAGLKDVLGCSGLTVKNCRMEDVGICVMTQYARSKNFYIADNVMIGRHDPNRLHGWHGLDDPSPLTSYYAVKVYGQGHVVCHNFISHFHDGVCVCTHGLPEESQDEKCVSIDFYNNDIFNMADDFIETDGGVHNIRVFRNRGVNAYHAALSAQPVFGGPAYFIRNVIYNVNGTALKFTICPAGLILYHNTICAGVSSNLYSNAHFRNNLFLGKSDRSSVFHTGSYTSYSSYDYDGFRIAPDARNNFSWKMPKEGILQDYDLDKTSWQSYPTLKEFSDATGMEKHGVIVGYDIFINVDKPDPELLEKVYPSEGLDFRLKPGASAVDAGCSLPNVNDGFSGNAPDLGALEFGKPVPVYGPRN